MLSPISVMSQCGTDVRPLMEEDALADVMRDEARLECMTLDEACSVLCLQCAEPAGNVVWEWWVFDTRRPQRSCRGKASSVENAKAAAIKALRFCRRAVMPDRRAAARPGSDRRLGWSADRPVREDSRAASGFGSRARG